jgi:predicted transcriptional regulator
MTLTIELPPDAERRLREKAVRQGEPVETVAVATLAEALEWEAQETAAAVEGIRRGLDDFEAGRCRSFQEFADGQRRKHLLSGSG